MNVDFLERGQGSTARAVVTTDLDGAQITHFSAGVIGENAPSFELPRVAVAGDLLLVGPENTKRMLQALAQGHARGLKVYFDPGQLIHTFKPEELQNSLEKISALLVNEYEWALFQSISGLSEAEIFKKVPLVWITKASEGVYSWRIGKHKNFLLLQRKWSIQPVPGMPFVRVFSRFGKGFGFTKQLKWELF